MIMAIGESKPSEGLVVVFARARILKLESFWLELEIEFPEQKPMITSFSGKGISEGISGEFCNLHCIMAPTGMFIRGILPNQDLEEVYRKIAAWVDGQDPARAKWCDCRDWQENHLYMGDAPRCGFCGRAFKK